MNSPKSPAQSKHSVCIHVRSVTYLIFATLLLTTLARTQTTYSVLHEFTGTDGASPQAEVILDKAGNLYGTTWVGGDPSCLGLNLTVSCGVVFELSPHANGSWSEAVLHTFTGPDGANPAVKLTFDAAGSLYGTTAGGGSAGGQGTVFKLTPQSDETWPESVLHSFGDSYGIVPYGPVIFDQSGHLYGTTASDSSTGNGTVFELAPNADGSWTESILHAFTGYAEGNWPLGLTFDGAGNLYGTALFSGHLSCNWPNGCGVIYKLAPNMDGTWTETPLHAFSGYDGNNPIASLIFDAAGNLYGVTSGGGLGFGVIFTLHPNEDGSWTEKVLHRFTGKWDGASPQGGLTADAAGNLYGTTSSGGKFGLGVIFELQRNSDGNWSEIVLHNLSGGSDGAVPLSGLMFDAAGNLYGTTSQGGDSSCNCGLVFRLSKFTSNLTLRSSTSPAQPVQGGSLTYTFKVWNPNSVNAVGEVLSTQVPTGTAFSSIELSGTAGLGSCTMPAVGASGPVLCNENSVMGPGSAWTIRLTVQVTASAGTVITEAATASSDNLGPSTARVQSTVQ